MNKKIDLSQKEKIMSGIIRCVNLTLGNKKFEKIYEKNQVVSFIGSLSIFLDDYNHYDYQRVKLTAALIYWDIIFELMEKGFRVFADDFEYIRELKKRNEAPSGFAEREELFFNLAAYEFYLIAHMELQKISPRKKPFARIFLIKS